MRKIFVIKRLWSNVHMYLKSNGEWTTHFNLAETFTDKKTAKDIVFAACFPYPISIETLYIKAD